MIQEPQDNARSAAGSSQPVARQQDKLPAALGQAQGGSQFAAAGANLIDKGQKVQLVTLIAACCCLLSGFAALVWQHALWGGAAFCLSGLVCGLTMKDVVSEQPPLVKAVLLFMAVGLVWATLVVYQNLNVLCLFPGFPIAFAGGQLVGAFCLAIARAVGARSR